MYTKWLANLPGHVHVFVYQTDVPVYCYNIDESHWAPLEQYRQNLTPQYITDQEIPQCSHPPDFTITTGHCQIKSDGSS